MDLENMRNEYSKGGLKRENLNDDPFLQFDHWFSEAKEAGLNEPNAMSLSTVNSKGQPSLRTVLLKHFDHKGFVFYTNYNSRKAKEIQENPNVAILFPWLGLERQVKICGKATKTSLSESVKYFASRPRNSQIGAWVSEQSKMIESRMFLQMKFEELKYKFKEGKIPLPDFWGGFRVKPHRIEFWQGRENRLHDRFEYILDNNDYWTIKRLAP